MHPQRSEDWQQAVGDRLRKTRTVMGLTQRAMCKSIGVSPSRWNNWEQGKRPLDLEAAVALCERHELTLDWLYRGVSAGLPYELGLKVDFRPIPMRPARSKRVTSP